MAQKRLPAEERKRQILRSAVKVFARSNYRTTRVADIAAETGVSEALVYKYFPTKKAVYLRILKHMSDRILAFWEEEAAKETDALKVIKHMGETYYKRMTGHSEELKVQFQAISEVDDEDIAAQLKSDHQRYVRFISGILNRGIEQGVIRPDVDVEALSWLMNGVGVLMNLTNLLSLDDSFNLEVIDRLITHMIESIRA